MHQLADADLIWQQCLFAFEEPSIDATFATIERTWLDDDSWIDYAPQWLHGADRIFGELIAVLPWQQREVTMYDRRLPEPRLTAWWDTASAAIEGLPILTEARTTLSRHYSRPFDSIGFNLYRDGHDSVAWHSDRERYALEDPTVAIVSTGQPRGFHVRPARRRSVIVMATRSRRSVRDGRLLPARLGALRAKGRRRRTASVDHVPPQPGRCRGERLTG